MTFSLPAALGGSGAALVVAGCGRRYDFTWRPLGATMIGTALALLATPALADQFIESADNGEVRCTISSRELTRIALVGDGFASVSKITTGDPTSDFTVTNEPVRGDIYLSVASGFASPGISFFATSKKGNVYKFSCTLGAAEATQVFVTNAAVVPEARASESARSVADDAIALIKTMATSALPDGYRVRQAAGHSTRVGALRVQPVAEYRGATMIGRVVRIDNTGTTPAKLAVADFVAPAAIAVSLGAETLDKGQSTTLWIVERTGAGA